MAEADDGFLSRWSRRKRAGGASPVVEAPGAPQAPAPPRTGPGPAPVATLAEPRAEETPDDAPPPDDADAAAAPDDLPDIDSLDKDSDYTVFLREGVPEALRKQALRKLWRSDPVLANLDGLNDYDENFRLLFRKGVAETVKSVFQLGKGMRGDDEKDEKEKDEREKDEREKEEGVEPAAETAAGEGAAKTAGKGEGAAGGDGAGDTASAGGETPPPKTPG